MELIRLQQNALVLEAEIQWFGLILEQRFKHYFQPEEANEEVLISPPKLEYNTDSTYSQVVQGLELKTEERLVLILALLPHIRPQKLDIFFTNNEKLGRPFTEFGGQKARQHNGFLPTGETAIWLLSGDRLEDRFKALHLFSKDHVFAQHNILSLDHNQKKEPKLSGVLQISKEYLSMLTDGSPYRPEFNNEFPAELMQTNLEWNDLVLPHDVLYQLKEIKAWLTHQNLLLEDWGLKKILKPGFRTLFYGPPGTGKSLTAALIGKVAQLPVYRIDLSKIVSKYIGETEKNLAGIFDQATNKNWILFFDEADSLFGKRGETKDARDRYANQEVSYLLQRIETFPGLVILATNFRDNVDEAFTRRFQSAIYFPSPDIETRLQLWEQLIPDSILLEASIDLEKIAEEYELTAGTMINVIRSAALEAATRSTNMISHKRLIYFIKREMMKEGKVF